CAASRGRPGVRPMRCRPSVPRAAAVVAAAARAVPGAGVPAGVGQRATDIDCLTERTGDMERTGFSPCEYGDGAHGLQPVRAGQGLKPLASTVAASTLHMPEADLYRPIKQFLEAQGYTV